MYLSVLAALLGEGLLLRSSLILVWAVTMTVAFHVFVVAYEEPTLRRRFGSDYDAYCRAVQVAAATHRTDLLIEAGTDSGVMSCPFVAS